MKTNNRSSLGISTIAIIALLLFAVPAKSTAAGDDRFFKYQGEVEASLLYGDDEAGELGISIINGVRFNRYLSAGVGIGVTTSLSDEQFMMPVFVDVKGYLPMSRRTSFLAVADIGMKTDFYTTGFYASPGAGISLRLSRKCALNITARYEYFGFSENISTPLGDISAKVKTNSFGIKIGLAF